MFPSRLIRGIDLVIEFATLGEYGLAPAPAPEAPPVFRVDLSGIGGETSASVERLGPSTPAARRLEAARSAAARPVAVSVPPVCRGARNAFGRTVRRGRTRAGSPTPRPQPCLVAEGQRTPG